MWTQTGWRAVTANNETNKTDREQNSLKERATGGSAAAKSQLKSHNSSCEWQTVSIRLIILLSAHFFLCSSSSSSSFYLHYCMFVCVFVWDVWQIGVSSALLRHTFSLSLYFKLIPPSVSDVNLYNADLTDACSDLFLCPVATLQIPKFSVAGCCYLQKPGREVSWKWQPQFV